MTAWLGLRSLRKHFDIVLIWLGKLLQCNLCFLLTPVAEHVNVNSVTLGEAGAGDSYVSWFKMYIEFRALGHLICQVDYLL